MRIKIPGRNYESKPKRRVINNCSDYSFCLGKIIDFNYDRGFGFIKSSYPKISKDVFVHISQLTKKNVYENTYVVCEYIETQKGLNANNVILDSDESFKEKIKENPNVFVEYVKERSLFPYKCWNFVEDENNRDACIEELLKEWLDNEDAYKKHFFDGMKDSVPDIVTKHPLFQELFLHMLEMTDFTSLDSDHILEILALAERIHFDIKNFISSLIVKISSKNKEVEIKSCAEINPFQSSRPLQRSYPVLMSPNVRILKPSSTLNDFFDEKDCFTVPDTVSVKPKRTKEYYRQKEAFIATGREDGPLYDKYVEDELADLYDEMKGMGFKKSSELSAYIKQHKKELQIKYGFITGVLDMEKDGYEYQFDGGIKTQYYARICYMLKLGNEKTDARVIREKSYNKIHCEEMDKNM